MKSVDIEIENILKLPLKVESNLFVLLLLVSAKGHLTLGTPPSNIAAVVGNYNQRRYNILNVQNDRNRIAKLT